MQMSLERGKPSIERTWLKLFAVSTSEGLFVSTSVPCIKDDLHVCASYNQQTKDKYSRHQDP